MAEVVHGPDGIVNGIMPGSAVVDLSTTGPTAVAALGADLPAGVAVVDAPVLGSIAEAEAGTLKLLVGGSADVGQPVLSSLAARCFMWGRPARVRRRNWWLTSR